MEDLSSKPFAKVREGVEVQTYDDWYSKLKKGDLVYTIYIRIE
jgi:hypothetical protein